MKKIVWTLACSLIFVTTWSQGWRHSEMEVKVFISNEQDLHILTGLTINLEPASTDATIFRAYLVPQELERLKKTNLKYEITIDDLNKHYERFWDNPLVPSGYYTYEQIIAIADSLVANFPGICKKEIWGSSIGGRQLAALKISDNVNTDEPEAEIMFDGGIHGDEVGGSQNVIMFARNLCLGYGSDPAITDLVNDREIWLYLMVNPDGRASMSRYNNNGVDCNRDNGYMWDGEGFSPSAFSQVETKALRNGILDNQFAVYTNYHSGTEIISFPWSYRANNPRDFQHLNQLAGIYSSTSGYPGGMQYGQGYNIMYAINGSTKDFQYGSLGNVGWSIEISLDKQPPASQIGYYYNANKPAMLEIIKRCAWGVSGIITDSLTGEPVRANVWVSNYYPVFTDPVVGDYHKYILPGTYSIQVTANGYKSKTITGVTVPAQGTIQTNFQLTPDTGWYAYKMMSCRIPGNNFGDEGYTPGCIGKPDNVPYSLGRNGWVILDMGDTIYDGPGVDFKVFQAGTQTKNFTVSGGNSQDGPFTVIGTGSGSTSFDIGPSLLGKIRYIQVKDNGSGSVSGTGAGFNLDAIAMITPPLKVNFSVNNQNPCSGTALNFTDQSAGNPVSWSWSFPGGFPSTSNIQNPTGIVYQTQGVYPVSLTISNGVSSLSKTKAGFISVIQSPVVLLGNDTTICDNESLQLHAGNPGASYLWSTGETTETIVVDSTGIGYGTQEYWVSVTGQNGCIGFDSINVTYDDCTGVTINAEEHSVLVYPNPVANTAIISVNGFRNGYWELISTDGAALARYPIASDNYHQKVDFSMIPNGISFLRVVRNQSVVLKKVVIWHP
ncbi:MAG: M14 family zinc carboxypeptidase [Bacteroidota bacterium]